ncbi:AAA family ATPase, partial [Paenibacillus thermoaerophilus]
MRIESMSIERFGMLSRCAIEPGEGATLIYGPNEAGKSTWMNFVRFGLFGFPPKLAPAEKYAPPGGGAYGGSVVVSWPDGLRIRIDRSESGAGRGGRSSGFGATLLGEGSASPPIRSAEAEYAARLGPVDGALFRRWFAVGLDDLRQLGALEGEAVGRFLQGAGWGGDGWAAAAAEEKLQSAMDKLYRPRGQREINATLQELEAAQRELRDAKEALGAFNEAVEEGRRLEREIEAAERRLAEKRRELLRLERAAEAQPHAARLAVHRERLAALGGEPEGDWPEDAAERLERLAAALEQAELELERAGRALREAREAAESLPDGRRDAPLLERRGELEALLAEAAVYREQRDRLAAAAEEERHLSERLSELLAQAGPDWTERRLREQRADLAAKDTIRAARDRIASLQRAAEQADAELVSAERLAAQAADAEREERQAIAALDDRLAALDAMIGAPEDDRAAAALWESLAAETAAWRAERESALVRERAEALLADERARLAAEADRQRSAGAAMLRRLAALLGAGGVAAGAAAGWAGAWPAAAGA